MFKRLCFILEVLTCRIIYINIALLVLMRRWALWANSIWKCIIILCCGTRRKITLVSNKVTTSSALLTWKRKKKPKLIPFYQQLSTAFQTFHIKPVGLLPRVLYSGSFLSGQCVTLVSLIASLSILLSHCTLTARQSTAGHKQLWRSTRRRWNPTCWALNLTPIFQQGGLAPATSLTLISPSVKWD